MPKGKQKEQEQEQETITHEHKANKIVIEGLANSGKTSLLKTLDEALVISYDDKPFPFPIPHKNITDLTDPTGELPAMDYFINQVDEAIYRYENKFNKYPRYLVIDSVSTLINRIDGICHATIPNVYGSTYREIERQIDVLIKRTNEYVESGITCVFVSHIVWNDQTKKLTELSKGKFGEKGGFLSTVDYAIYIERKGKVFSIHTRGKDVARTLLEDVPDSYDSSTFSLQEYLNLIENHQQDVSAWAI